MSGERYRWLIISEAVVHEFVPYGSDRPAHRQVAELVFFARRPRVTATADSLPVLLSVEALAEHLGVTVRHVRQLVAERGIPYIKWGHLLRFDPIEVSEWLQQQRVPPQPPRGQQRY